MQIQRQKHAGELNTLFQIMLCVIAVFITPIVAAQEAGEICQIDSIKTSFKQYVQTVDQAQVQHIQEQLMAGGYGPVVTDGVLGTETRHALQRLCQDFEVEDSDTFIEQLLNLLEMSNTVWKKHPDWRLLIKNDVFKAWLHKKPEQEQKDINKTFQSGPAKQVIAILDIYVTEKQADEKKEVTPKKPSLIKKAVAFIKKQTIDKKVEPIVAKQETEKKAVLPKQTTLKKQLPSAIGPLFFYRWQPPEEDADEDTDSNDKKTVVDEPLPDDILDELAKIQGKAYPNKFIFKKALATIFADSGIKYLSHQKQILQQAQNGPVKELNQIQLNGGDCGCSREFSDLVYGFYPYWQATDDGPQEVDFSLLDRIGFYALSLNHKGEILNHLQWRDKWNVADFINEAHRFRVAVDLTLYATGWQKWSDTVIDDAASNVVKAVTQSFKASNPNILRTILPFVKDTSFITADGVTLFFDDYTTPNSGKIIVTFVTKVAELLDEAEADVKLNIILGMNMSSSKKELLFKKLRDILFDNKKSKHPVDYVFTFLQEPTENSKTILRRTIEDTFNERDEITLLRKITPIISPIINEENAKQLENDLIYFQDNFAGVGFWPLPLNSDEQIDILKKMLTDLYQVEVESNHVGELIDDYAPGLCAFVCPNRWLFRIGFDLLIGMLALYALLAIWIYRLRVLYKQYSLYFIAVCLATMLVLLASLICDPFWNERADSVAISVFLTVVTATVFRSVRKAMQPPLP